MFQFLPTQAPARFNPAIREYIGQMAESGRTIVAVRPGVAAKLVMSWYGYSITTHRPTLTGHRECPSHNTLPGSTDSYLMSFLTCISRVVSASRRYFATASRS